MLKRFNRSHENPTAPAALRSSAAAARPEIAAIPVDELVTLDRLADVVEFDTGQELATADSLGTTCYFVLDGRLDVIRDGETIADVTPGWFAGEMSMRSQQRRNATLRAAEPTRAYRLGRGEFETLVATSPAIRSHVDATMQVRVAG